MIGFTEKGWIPDNIIRYGIRHLISSRIKEEAQKYQDKKYFFTFLDKLKKDDIAVHTQDANEQHYELPPDFFNIVLGPHRKYSSCFWDFKTKNLKEAEQQALQITCERAELKDGQDILELGCGWGSLSLWMAENYPYSKIVAISNSSSQKKFIDQECEQRGIENLKVITENITRFDSPLKFDRIVSVEMFEHMRNYELLFKKISKWLKNEGKLFVHIFSHKKYSYLFGTKGTANWMGRYFFTGGIMPSQDLLKNFRGNLEVEEQWTWNGRHYQKTAESWLKNMDNNKTKILSIFKSVYKNKSTIWFHRWRIFFLACAELFGYKQGQEWNVSHYRFVKND